MKEEPARLTPNQRARLEVIAGGKEPDAGTVQITYASDVKSRETRWLWDGRIPLGAVTGLVGRQGLGKTTLVTALAAHASRGRLAGHAMGEDATTLFVTAEDDPETTLVPRLRASQGEPGKVAFVHVERAGTITDLILPQQTEQLAEIARSANVRLIVLDPLKAFIGELNPNRDEDMRKVLRPLDQLAKRLDLAVVPIFHFNKSDTKVGLDKVGGAGAFTQAARSVLFFGLDPDDPAGESGSRRVLAHAKCNLGPLAPSVVMELHSVELGDGVTGTTVLRGERLPDVKAQDVIETNEQRAARTEAQHFLEVELAGGAAPVASLIKKARGVGIDPRALYKAKPILRIKAMPAPEMPGGWSWSMPRR